ARSYKPLPLPCVSLVLHRSGSVNRRCGVDSEYIYSVLCQMPVVYQCFAAVPLRLTGDPP
ncbi:hypothetical protein HAX54_017902, partial [Datura stramonium]|nr:hypothetical protein [Datura stramonium]